MPGGSADCQVGRQIAKLEFIRFGAMDANKPYKSIGFGAMDTTKPYRFIRVGAYVTHIDMYHGPI